MEEPRAEARGGIRLFRERAAAGAALVALGTLGLAPPVDAQTRTTAGVRGRVVDEQGLGLEGVTIDMEFKGESRVKVTRQQTTDKKGGYVRMGLLGGPWRLAFSKPGFEPQQIDTHLSAGGFSELPDTVMKPARPVPQAPAEKDAVAPVLPAESASLKDVYNKAVEASRGGSLDEAERLYREVLEKLPDLGEVRYNLGQVYLRKDDLASAEAEFRRATELRPGFADAHIALAAVLGSGGKTQEAADILGQAAAKFEGHAKFQYALGTMALNAGRSDEAEAALRKAAALDPAHAEPHYYLATLAVGRNKVPEAIAELEAYLRMDGQDPQNLATAKSLLAALKTRK